MALLAADGTPGSCEADVYGNITGLVLQWLAGSASFVADLVHLDPISNTGVFWHCGLAPFELADADAVPVATIHSNRAMPLLSEFPLKPGRVTLARFSQSRGVHRLVIGTAEMLRAPLAFSGTAGVARFDAPVNDIEDTILGEGLEHHYGLVYGDVSEELRAVAALLALPVVEL
jgi:L-fucose isomerase-like protein